MVALSLSQATAALAGSIGGPFELGVVLGEPSGLTAKYFITDTQALDSAVGFGLSGLETFQFHMDYLWHPQVLATTTSFRLPFYLGVGPVIQIVDDDRDRKRRDLVFGARVPFGLVFVMDQIALNPFIEVAPGVELYAHVGVRIDAAIGVRHSF